MLFGMVLKNCSCENCSGTKFPSEGGVVEDRGGKINVFSSK
jgi:hypothetical protein